MKKTNLFLFVLILGTLLIATEIHGATPTINSCEIPSSTQIYPLTYGINHNITNATIKKFMIYNIDDQNELYQTGDKNETYLWDNWNDADYNSNPTWIVTSGTWTATNNDLRQTELNSGRTIYTTIENRTYNDINIEFSYFSTGTTSLNNHVNICITNTTTYLGGNFCDGNGYWFQIRDANSNYVQLRKITDQSSSIIGFLNIAHNTNILQKIRISRNQVGDWKVFVDGNQMFTGSENTYNTFDTIMIRAATASGFVAIDDLNIYNESNFKWRTDQNTYSIRTTDTLDYLQYGCYACNNGECTTKIYDWNNTIDRNIKFNITNRGINQNNYLATFTNEQGNIVLSDSNIESENISTFLNHDNRPQTYSIRIDDTSNLPLFSNTLTQIISDDTNIYNLAVEQPDINIVFANSTMVSGKIIYATTNQNGQLYQDFTNISQIYYDQNTIPTGLTKIVFNGNTGTNDFNQTYMYYNNIDFNTIDENIWTISGLITGFLQINVKDKTGSPINDAIVRTYQQADTNSYRLTNQYITGSDGIATIWANSFGILRIEVQATGYTDTNTTIENRIFIGTGSTLDISLNPIISLPETFIITASPINKKIREIGTIARINVNLQKNWNSCILTTSNIDTNIIGTYISNSKQYTRTISITNPSITYNALIYIDTDNDTNCYDNYIARYQWYYDNNQYNYTIPSVTDYTDDQQREINFFLFILLVIVSGIVGFFFRKGLITFFLGTIILTISGTNAFFVPSIIGLVFIIKDPINRFLARR